MHIQNIKKCLHLVALVYRSAFFFLFSLKFRVLQILYYECVLFYTKNLC